ncbi:hypothetical protein ACQP2T_51890 [Nonomuraea sp. CA-143628]|uniref:hypothetical protein n=1 Tax=Nonomuraea sp. CA-143628 TaxID=3239997 RepID=UPI003D8A9D84
MQAVDGHPSYDEPAALVVEQARVICASPTTPRWCPPPTTLVKYRALRPVKTQVKIPGCHQPETGAAAWLAVRSYLDSTREHSLIALDSIRRASTGHLWVPPIA